MKIDVYVLDVRTGDCQVVQYTAEGDEHFGLYNELDEAGQSIITYKKTFTILIDGGKSYYADGIIECLRQHKFIGFFNERWSVIDVVVISHWHDDHYGGIFEIFNSVHEKGCADLYNALSNVVIISPVFPTEINFRLLLPISTIKWAVNMEFLDESQKSNPLPQFIDLQPIIKENFFTQIAQTFEIQNYSGEKMNIPDDIYIRILAADSLIFCDKPIQIEVVGDNKIENCKSIVMLFTCGDFNYLTSGDMENEGEILIAQVFEIPLALMKVSHHGGSSATPKEKLEIHKPLVTFVSTNGEKYGLPNYEFFSCFNDYVRISLASNRKAKRLALTGFSSMDVVRLYDVAKLASLVDTKYANKAAAYIYNFVQSELFKSIITVLEAFDCKSIFALLNKLGWDENINSDQLDLPGVSDDDSSIILFVLSLCKEKEFSVKEFMFFTDTIYWSEIFIENLSQYDHQKVKDIITSFGFNDCINHLSINDDIAEYAFQKTLMALVEILNMDIMNLASFFAGKDIQDVSLTLDILFKFLTNDFINKISALKPFQNFIDTFSISNLFNDLNNFGQSFYAMKKEYPFITIELLELLFYPNIQSSDINALFEIDIEEDKMISFKLFLTELFSKDGEIFQEIEEGAKISDDEKYFVFDLFFNVKNIIFPIIQNLSDEDHTLEILTDMIRRKTNGENVLSPYCINSDLNGVEKIDEIWDDDENPINANDVEIHVLKGKFLVCYQTSQGINFTEIRQGQNGIFMGIAYQTHGMITSMDNENMDTSPDFCRVSDTNENNIMAMHFSFPVAVSPHFIQDDVEQTRMLNRGLPFMSAAITGYSTEFICIVPERTKNRPLAK